MAEGYINTINTMVQLYEEKNLPTTATAKDCNWQLYNILFFEYIHYDNVRNTIVVPKVYFSTTNQGGRILLFDSNSDAGSPYYEVYQNGNSHIYVRANIENTNGFGIRIYGMN